MPCDPWHRTSDGGNSMTDVDRDRMSTWAFVAETHAPALRGHGKCWFLACPVIKPIFLSRKSISQLPGNCFSGKYSWGWITLISIAFLQLIIFERNWDSAKRWWSQRETGAEPCWSNEKASLAAWELNRFLHKTRRIHFSAALCSHFSRLSSPFLLQTVSLKSCASILKEKLIQYGRLVYSGKAWARAWKY